VQRKEDKSINLSKVQCDTQHIHIEIEDNDFDLSQTFIDIKLDKNVKTSDKNKIIETNIMNINNLNLNDNKPKKNNEINKTIDAQSYNNNKLNSIE